ncbi:MAG: putative DNA binding domain-containing protein [Gammaproteobacteria bacterium]|nr:MloB [Rhodocyclaceae bacterium]MBU3909299.1 putative DNA binding domain-containing protein [Gammaproteobacteria bacterium]MBU3989710.1 putative DNA binding domain-containing protein [Gammaproteobacteria bacterium]MBU4005541.1 putative DNA binding domain-containing protein [Gammaproteobacteria bacterium]MBU4020906.1 putative DNA binding domain-containing protein [Gammaproteobacteria bacterium]
MITLDTLSTWLLAPAESEHLEFKEAKQQFDTTKLLRYCVALANEGGGHLVLGVSDKLPRQVVGTQAFAAATALNDIKSRIVDKLRIRVDAVELAHVDGRVLVFGIPSRPVGQPLDFDGAYLMRAGEDLVPMTPDQLRRIFAEGLPDWFAQVAKERASADEVIALLDTQTYFDLSRLPYPTTREGVLSRLSGEGLIVQMATGWAITNLAAILLAKRLDGFSPALARKAPRVVIYEGLDKTHTREDKPGNRGYAVGFESLVDFVHSAAPQNRSIEQVVREEVKMFPKQALRELIANALVHQDFDATGASVMIEMYADRVEVSNPGKPPISVERFIDEFRSRNERLADFMRRLGICEEKGSGVDKVVKAAEVFQLPAPDFRVGELRTTAVLFAHQDFAAMSRTDRVRACYQHCCLMYVSNQRMSNQSLRERFGLPESKAATVSLVIGAAKEAGAIKADESETSSTRYARYLPFWA